MLIARREMSIGPEKFEIGAEITAAAQQALPPGRLNRMIGLGWIEDLDNSIDVGARLGALEASVQHLTELVEQLLTSPKVTSK